ncbi:MAG: glutamine synthetase family protein [Pseudomonadota bacterium]
MQATTDQARLDEVRGFLADNPDLETLELLVPDTNGILRGKWAPPEAALKAFSSGIQLPLSVFGLDVWGREVPETGLHIETGDVDGTCFGVPGSLKRVPWAPRPTAQVLLAIHEPNGSPFAVDPRRVLARVLEASAAQDLTPVAATEMEFYLLKVDESSTGAPPIPHVGSVGGIDPQHMYGMAELDELERFLAGIREAAIAQDLPVDTILSEAATSQFEVNLSHRDDAMAAADDAVLLRRLISGVARRHGLKASFMAKPFQDWPGNGMHVHVSLLDGSGSNIFACEKTGETRLEHAIAGCLQTMPAALALFINTFNGYRRLAPGSYAPTLVAWGENNRSVAVRVPGGPAAARRLEHRVAGGDAHPHLVMAGVLAGVVSGLESQQAPPAAATGNAYDGVEGAMRLTHDMGQAVEALDGSDELRAILGRRFVDVFTALKRAELDAFMTRITSLEHLTYL